MPKRTLDIRGFFAGLFQDHHDPQTPIEAQTVITTNVEVTRRNTVRLVKRPKALVYDLTGVSPVGVLQWIKNIFLAKKPEILEYREQSNYQFYTVDDISSRANPDPSEPEAGPMLTNVENALGFAIDRDKINGQISNLAIHIGTGNGPNNDPIWIGKYRHTQFGQIPDQRYHATAAHCRRPNLGENVFEATHKAVYINGKIYTIDYNSEYINRFADNGEFEERILFAGASFTAICKDSVTSGYLLVYNSSTDEIWRINSNLEYISKMTPGGGEWTAPTGDEAVTDMEASGNFVYLGVIDTSTNTLPAAFVFAVPYSSDASATPTVVDVSFQIAEDTDSDGFANIGTVSAKSPGLVHNSIEGFADKLTTTLSRTITPLMVYDHTSVLGQAGGWSFTASPIFLVPLEGGYIGILSAPKYTGTTAIQYNDGIDNQAETLGVDDYGFLIPNPGTETEEWAVNGLFIVHGNKEHMDAGVIHDQYINGMNPQALIEVSEILPLGTSTDPYTSVQKIEGSTFDNVVISHFEDTTPSYTRAKRYGTSAILSDLEGDFTKGVPVNEEPYFIEGNLKYRLIEHGNFLIIFSPTGSDPRVWRRIATGTGYVDDNSGEPVSASTPTMTASLGTGDGGFVDNTVMSRLYYRCSFIYDGIQESALSDRVVIDNIQESDDEKPVEIQIKIPLSISRRITHLNIYRAMSLISNVEEGFYRLVESIPLNTTFTIDAGTWVIAYTDRKDLGRLGPTFESSAGLPEALRNTIPNYGLSVMLNDRLYVADCWHPDVDDARLFLFRSNRYAVNIFNWPEENIRLPETPVAMEEFSNRLFVFTKSSCIVVNPESMYVERVFDGIGALGRNAVAKTPSGLYVAGRNHAYIFTGVDRQVISDPIEAPMQVKYDFNWQAFAQGENHNVCYHEERNEILFSTTLTMANAALNGTLIFGYHLVDRRWRREYQVGDKWKQLVPTSHGEVAIATESGMKWPNASTLDVEEVRIDNFNKVNSIYSRDIDFGDMLNHKWIYAIKVRATDKNFELFMNDVPLEKGITTEPMFYFKVPEQLRKQRSVRLRIRPKGAEIGQVSIIHRTKIIHAGKDF